MNGTGGQWPAIEDERDPYLNQEANNIPLEAYFLKPTESTVNTTNKHTKKMLFPSFKKLGFKEIDPI